MSQSEEVPPGLRFNDIRDDYDDEFGVTRPPEEIVRRWLLVPGIAYVLIGLLTGLPVGFLLFGSFCVIFRQGFREDDWRIGNFLGLMVGLLAVLGWSVLIFAGGTSLLTRKRYRLAIAGSLAVVALGIFGIYCGILAYPFGVFALTLLIGPYGQKLFGHDWEVITPEVARRRLKSPSVWMTRVAILLISFALVGVVFLACLPSLIDTHKQQKIAILFGLVAMPLIIPLLVWIAFTGRHMAKLQRRQSCLVAAYIMTSCAIFPYVGILIFPFGVWALVWLHHPDVRRFFDQPEITSLENK